MDYKEALAYIENTGKFGINLGLQRIERLCQLMGDPQKELRVVHVAGTNGKGSTTTFISSVLMSQGYRVGIYTSPYIERFTERIKINDEEISQNDIARLVTDMQADIERLREEGLEHPTEFEIITACAFKYFKENNVDFVVLEVGLGGRYDATNIVDPLVSVITTISYDHMNILGDTMAKIAYEKAGIIKPKRPVVIYPQEKEAMDVLVNASRENRSQIFFVGDMEYEILSNTLEGIIFNARGEEEYKRLKINLLGEHQVLNALTALRSIEVLNKEGYIVEKASIFSGLENAKWPARFELLGKNPYIVLDGGHNIQGINSLVEGVKKYFHGKRIRVVCGMLKDKEYRDMIIKLGEICDEFVTVQPNSPRAMTAIELKEVVESLGKKAVPSESIYEGVKNAIEVTKGDEILVFCGSLYMIGEVRSILKKDFLK